ncbi:MAG: hypothetical protein E7270_00920 [Lachnospiraceae bacterium]|nr:hypothetical protein [Lachnospiraceae bacterium]
MQEQRTNLVNDQEEKQETLDHLIEDKNYLFNVLIPKSTELDNLYTQLENLNNQLTTVSTAREKADSDLKLLTESLTANQNIK